MNGLRALVGSVATAKPEVEIQDVLNRRTDLSTFVVHLTKGDDPKGSLLSILGDHRIAARTAMGCATQQAATLGDAATNSQKVVCFSETPLDQIHSLFADIAGRKVRLKGYGLAFTKTVARRNMANPCWYFNLNVGTYSEIGTALFSLRDQACVDEATFLANPARHLFPFCEWMGTSSSGTQHEFWWEREWRRIGDFVFTDAEIALVLCPETDHKEFEALLPGKCIDPRWSLERMIAKLVGLRAADVTPFASR
jgi:Putative abortive phage resistance protein AbiGi, antitoxin